MSTGTEGQNVRLRAEVYGKMLDRFTESVNEIIGLIQPHNDYMLRKVKVDLNGYEIKYRNNEGKNMRRFYTHDENPVVKTIAKPVDKPEAKAVAKPKKKVAKPVAKPVAKKKVAKMVRKRPYDPEKWS